MYSGDELGRIVRHYRKIVKPRELKEIADATRPPNDILMSYFIEDFGLGRDELAEILNDLKELNSLLQLCAPKPLPGSGLPALDDSMDYSMPLEWISSSIENRTGKFCCGYGDKLIAADKKRKEHMYPSGEKVGYFELADEISANIPILDAAYLSVPSGEIYVRANSVAMMLALMDVQRENPDFSRYINCMKDFGCYINGIILAHEKSEREIVKSGEITTPCLQLELESEHRARQFLERHGVDLMHYKLYHLLRANRDEERGKNISQIVVEQCATL